MKNPIINFWFALASFACSPSNNVILSDLNSSRYRYILDFDSKVSQQKMRYMRGYYSRASTGIFFINVLGNSTSSNDMDHQTDMPKLSKKIKLINNEVDTLFADLITEIPLNHEYNCSVRKIYLPRNQTIDILTVLDEPYELIYSWNHDSPDKRSFNFYPNSYKVLRISREGVNKTVIINDY